MFSPSITAILILVMMVCSLGEFVATYDYQPILDGVVPPGLDVKVDLQTGRNEARIPSPWRLQIWVDTHIAGSGSPDQVLVGESKSMDVVHDDGSSAAKAAAVGRPNKHCIRGCFSRVDVYPTQTADDVKRSVLLDVCQAATKAESSGHDRASVCQISVMNGAHDITTLKIPVFNYESVF